MLRRLERQRSEEREDKGGKVIFDFFSFPWGEFFRIEMGEPLFCQSGNKFFHPNTMLLCRHCESAFANRAELLADRHSREVSD